MFSPRRSSRVAPTPEPKPAGGGALARMCKHKKKDKKREKERLKEEETEEEKRARRLAKKAAKAAKRQESSQVAGYSNQDNPWNDPNLAESFVWGKKVEKDRARGVEELSREGQKRKKLEMQMELEKVKRAREQREIDREAYEEEREDAADEDTTYPYIQTVIDTIKMLSTYRFKFFSK